MTLDQFSEITQVMCNALPCSGQERRMQALYKYFGQRVESLIAKASDEAARTLDRFPTPKTFGELVDKHRPKISGYEAIQNWKPKPPMSDSEFCERMLAGDPEKMLLGILVSWKESEIEKAPAPVQRIWNLGKDLVGPSRLEEIRSRAARLKNGQFSLSQMPSRMPPGLQNGGKAARSPSEPTLGQG